MADEFEFGNMESGEGLAGIVAKLRGNLKSKDAVVRQLKQAARLLEQLPQEVALLGGARPGLQAVLVDRHVLGSKHKDVRMYLAVCMAHMLRIYAPDLPWEDKELEPVIDLLLWSVQQVQEFQAPTFELAVSVLQTISQTKSYYMVLDMQREDSVLDWVRALLQCINTGSSALAGHHAMEVLNGMVGSEEGHTDDVLEVLLSHVVPPKSVENPAACQLALAVLRACEADIKPQLQKYLTKLIQCPISSNSDLHRQCYALIYQLYQTIPQVLLPVLPHLTSELQAEEGPKRLEAVCLMGKLFSLPGNRLVCEYTDMLDALLERYQDTQAGVRIKVLEFTPSLVAAAGDEAQQKKVLQTAAIRLQDFDERVRVAAVKLVCQTVRQLLVGPTQTAAGAACKQHVLALSSPTADLLGGLGSQEEDALAAEELSFTPPEAAAAGSSAEQVQATVRDLACLQDVMASVKLRLQDKKTAVRKAAASGMMSVFRAVVAAAGDSQQVELCSPLPAHVLGRCQTDVELRQHVVDVVMRDGLLGAQLAPAQAAAAWARVWLMADEQERQAVVGLVGLRAKLQACALQFVGLRRKLSGKEADDSCDPEAVKADLDKAAREVAKLLPDPQRAAEGLAALQAVRDNHVFASLQQALALGATAETYAKYRADVLSRLGSKGAAAELASQLLLWARPAAWLPQPLLAAVLELAAGDPGGEQGPLVLGATELLEGLSKHAGALFASLLPQLYELLCSPEQDLQQLAVHVLAHCAINLRKRGHVLASSPDAATATLVQERLLLRLRALTRGKPAGAATAPVQRRPAPDDGSAGVTEEGCQAADARQVCAAEGVCAPKAAKWAVYALVCCQDGSSARAELNALADELAGDLDSGSPYTPAKLQALSAIGRLYPVAFGRHVDRVMRFVLDDYLLSYLDAAATGAAAGLRSPGSECRSQAPSCSPGGGPSQAEATAVWYKAAALKALAAGCVPDQDSSEVPVETLRAVARLADELEGLLDPGEDGRPAFLASAPGDACGHLRLAAAAALLRLARRHDSRLSPGCYCMLGLVMQDDLEEVRQGFAAKVQKLMNYFQQRPSTHQLSAKYAAMLPLAGMDPSPKNKHAAADMLHTFVRRQRRHVQQLITAAAAAGGGSGGAQGGGSTLTDLPEMMLPYSLYLLAHHPDFPQADPDEEVEACCYEPFQLMLQFMLAELLAASGGTPAGATAPVLLKMCRTLKRTADTAAEPANRQLYVLCDMAAAVIAALAGELHLQLSAAPDHPGLVVLPRGLYRPLDKGDKVGGVRSHLPPGFEVTVDNGARLVLLQPDTTVPPAAPAGRNGNSKQLKGAAAGRGSKRKPPAAQKMASSSAEGEKQPLARKRAKAGGRGTAGRRKAAAAFDSDGEGDSDSGLEDAPAGKADQQLTRRQQLLQQQKEQKQQQQSLARSSSPAATDSGAEAAADSALQQHESQQQQQQEEEDEHEGDDKGVQRVRGKQQQPAAKAPRARQPAQAAGGGGGEAGVPAAAATAAGTQTALRQKIVLKPQQAQPPPQQNGKQQQRPANGRALQQKQLSFQAAPADASSPAPAARHMGSAAAHEAAGQQERQRRGGAWDDEATGEPAAAGRDAAMEDAATADSPASQPAATARGEHMPAHQPAAARASKKTVQASAAADDDDGDAGEQQADQPAAGKPRSRAAAADVAQPARRGRAAKSTKAAAARAGKKAAVVAPAVSDASMQEDQEERRRKAAASAAGRKRPAASKAAAAGGGAPVARVTRRRAA